MHNEEPESNQCNVTAIKPVMQLHLFCPSGDLQQAGQRERYAPSRICSGLGQRHLADGLRLLRRLIRYRQVRLLP